MKKFNTYFLSLCVLLFSGITFAAPTSSMASSDEKPVMEAKETTTQPEANLNQHNPNLVNLNTASAEELKNKLIGIGAKKAQAIVEYREKQGKFVDIEQLTEISGIGKSTLEKNRSRIIIE